MIAPAYYHRFQCVADRCTHSCCIGWEIDVDEETLSLYRSLPKEQDERITKSIAMGEDGAHFALCAGERCPHLTQTGLCRIICELGEAYLCDICREHPRFYNEVDGHVECGLGVACEEAARLVLESRDYRTMLSVDGEESLEAVRDSAIFSWRDEVYALLSDDALPFETRCERLSACHGTRDLDGQAQRELLASLEYMEDSHRTLLLSCVGACVHTEQLDGYAERLLAYLIYRHATGEAESARRAAVSFALFLVRLFCALVTCHGYEPVRAAVLLSEELEYSEENTAALLAAFQK